MVRGPGTGLPPLWRGAGGGVVRQRQAAGGPPRSGHSRGRLQRSPARLCALLGLPSRACAPYRARTKGKDENGVGYVKKNAIAGHRFASWAALEAHLAWWMREVADVRVHGTTGEPPIERFRREEAAALRSLEGRPPFRQVREVVRRVQADGSIDLDTNLLQRALAPHRRPGPGRGGGRPGAYLPRRGRGRRSRRAPRPARARHRRRPPGRHHRSRLRGDGVARCRAPAPAGELLRPLSEYERVAGGAW